MLLFFDLFLAVEDHLLRGHETNLPRTRLNFEPGRLGFHDHRHRRLVVLMFLHATRRRRRHRCCRCCHWWGGVGQTEGVLNFGVLSLVRVIGDGLENDPWKLLNVGAG